MFPAGVIASEKLRSNLTALEATTPVCICTKTMVASDMDGSQNRLLISCKKKKKKNGEREQNPFADIFTEKERLKVHHQEQEQAESEIDNSIVIEGCCKEQGKRNPKSMRDKKRKRSKGEDEKQEESKKKVDDEKEKEKGLALRAYDRDGQPYDLKLRFLDSNTAYRIIGRDWKIFLENNGLLGGAARPKRRKTSPGEEGGESPMILSCSPDEEGADGGEHQADVVNMELWAFRSRKLNIGETAGHPDGALGLLLLHHREGEFLNAEEDEEMNVAATSNDAGIAVVDDEGMMAMAGVAGKPDEPVPPSATREARLTPVEVFGAQSMLLLKVRDCNDRDASNCVCKQGPKCSTCSDPFRSNPHAAGSPPAIGMDCYSVPNMN